MNFKTKQQSPGHVTCSFPPKTHVPSALKIGETSEKLWALPLLTIKGTETREGERIAQGPVWVSQVKPGSLWAVPVPPIRVCTHVSTTVSEGGGGKLTAWVTDLLLISHGNFRLLCDPSLNSGFSFFHLAGQDLRCLLMWLVTVASQGKGRGP